MSRTLWCILCILASGCVVTPNHGDNIGSKSSPVSFEIYATEADANLSITCSSHYGTPTTIASFSGGNSPLNFRGDTLYLKQHSMVIPDACWEPWSGTGYAYITYLRVKQGSYNAAVFDEAGMDCLAEEIVAEGSPPISAGSQCMRSGADILLYATP